MAFDLFSRLLHGALGGAFGTRRGGLLIDEPPLAAVTSNPRDRFDEQIRTYEALFEYYKNVGLYDQLRAELRRRYVPPEAIKGIYSPAYRTVEFYVGHVWPGPLDTALPIEGASAALKTAINQIWTWSNWQVKKELAVRRAGIFGDLFMKVAQAESLTSKRVFIQIIDPRIVTEFSTDERDYLTRIRLDQDVPSTDPLQGNTVVRTEIWDKSRQDLRIWLHNGIQYDVEKLTPTESHAFREYGVDFVPFTHSKFRDIGEERGVGAYTMAVDKVDEVNRAATRLHQILYRYNRPTLALTAGGETADHRPLPAPRIGNQNLDTSEDGIPFGDTEMVSMPGTSDVKYLVPNLDYAAALSVVNGQMAEIEKDLPEILWYRLTEMNDPTGRAIRFYLGAAVKHVIEVRASLEAGLVRANQMAITIGQNMKLAGFKELGTYAAGDLDHHFAAREVIEIDDLEVAQGWQAAGQAGTYWREIGIKAEVIAERLDFKKSDIDPEGPPQNQTGGMGLPSNTKSQPDGQQVEQPPGQPDGKQPPTKKEPGSGNA